MKAILFCALFVTLAVFHANAVPEGVNCPCPRIYYPVCSTDAKTFNNKCEFECYQEKNRSVRIAREGRCEEENIYE
ncbi:PREDICTED: ovomucoid-like [Nicrophorus vespilloides]|uniref:Ovomucoid-like n=1 Tax=Nicrophorus vespilloides TaxID=110193 RepID=A0ABM1M8W5_NICVS|nr:PREDICTED: ovomucoid-like [Nicrophorus vespilloides]